jgi:hypothetical protein
MPHVDNTLTERLIHAGGASDTAVTALVNEVGLDAVNEVLIDEIVFRCPEPENKTPANIALDVSHPKERRRTVFRMLRDEPIQPVEVAESDIHMVLEIHVKELIRRLFGPVRHRRTGDFRNSFLPSGTAHLPHFASAARATNTLLAGCTNTSVDLGSLAVGYGSDKWASLHWYTPHYETHLARFRNEPVRLLEIGIGGEDRELGGASLKMWKRYFHRGLVFGLDIFDKSALDQRRLTALVGDQQVPDDLIAIGERYGPFDIIIDDGSHIGEHVHTSFNTLLPYVRDGGIYVIEDLQTSYLPEFGGSPGHVAEPHTGVGLVKQLLDDLHFQEHARGADRQLKPTEGAITGVHVYHSIVFLEKGMNGEEGFPAWHRQLGGAGCG